MINNFVHRSMPFTSHTPVLNGAAKRKILLTSFGFAIKKLYGWMLMGMEKFMNLL
jgi:hypothetical protein